MCDLDLEASDPKVGRATPPCHDTPIYEVSSNYLQRIRSCGLDKKMWTSRKCGRLPARRQAPYHNTSRLRRAYKKALQHIHSGAHMHMAWVLTCMLHESSTEQMKRGHRVATVTAPWHPILLWKGYHFNSSHNFENRILTWSTSLTPSDPPTHKHTWEYSIQSSRHIIHCTTRWHYSGLFVDPPGYWFKSLNAGNTQIMNNLTNTIFISIVNSYKTCTHTAWSYPTHIVVVVNWVHLVIATILHQ
jgi:hypothetical protein